MPAQPWPSRLWLVRHGESAGNVARDRAYATGQLHIDIAVRDVEVPLSERGIVQSDALARWFARMSLHERPQRVLVSPYVRARQSADALRAGDGLVPGAPPDIVDERLREREFGILDRLTHAGIEKYFPEQARFRRDIGKFYHRPPGGESWCDVVLRLRSVLDTLSLHHAGCRVLVVAHEVIVQCFRYLIEEMDEAQILAIDRQGDVVNCGVTEYAAGGDGKLRLVRFNFAAPLEEEGVPVTDAPDQSGGAR